MEDNDLNPAVQENNIGSLSRETNKMDPCWHDGIRTILFEEMGLTTFLQIFFAPAYYCHTLNVHFREELNLSESEFEQRFYAEAHCEKLKDCLLEHLNKLEGATKAKDKDKLSVAAVLKRIIETLNEISISQNVVGQKLMSHKCFNNNKPEEENEPRGKLVGVNTPQKYKKPDFLFDHYVRYQDFYIPYIANWLECIDKSHGPSKKELKNVYEIMDSIQEYISEKKKYTLSFYSDSDYIFMQLAYYVYIFLLVKMNPEYCLDDEIKSFSRLRKTKTYFSEESNNYASVTEYYPVNTIERLAALKQLFGQGNLYAAQDLYFIYSHDTLLYSIDGSRRYFISADREMAKQYYRKIENSGEKFFPVHFHDKEEYENPDFVSSLIRKYRKEYTAYNETELHHMMKKLQSVYLRKQIPVNLDLMCFMREMAEKYSFLKHPFGYCLWRIERYFMDNPDIDEILKTKEKKDTSDMQNMELHVILLNMLKFMPDTEDTFLIEFCRNFTSDNKTLLQEYETIAIDTATQYFRFNLNSGSEEAKRNTELFGKISNIIKKTIEQIK